MTIFRHNSAPTAFGSWVLLRPIVAAYVGCPFPIIIDALPPLCEM